MATYRIKVDAPKSRAKDPLAYNQEAENYLPLSCWARLPEGEVEVWAVSALNMGRAIEVSQTAAAVLKVNVLPLAIHEGCEACGQLAIVRVNVTSLQGTLLNQQTLCRECALDGNVARADEGDINAAEEEEAEQASKENEDA